MNGDGVREFVPAKSAKATQDPGCGSCRSMTATFSVQTSSMESSFTGPAVIQHMPWGCSPTTSACNPCSRVRCRPRTRGEKRLAKSR